MNSHFWEKEGQRTLKKGAHTTTSRRAVSKCSKADNTPPELKPTPPSKPLSHPVVQPDEEEEDDETDEDAEAGDVSHSTKGVPPPPPLLRRDDAFKALPFLLRPVDDDGDDSECVLL